MRNGRLVHSYEFKLEASDNETSLLAAWLDLSLPLSNVRSGSMDVALLHPPTSRLFQKVSFLRHS